MFLRSADYDGTDDDTYSINTRGKYKFPGSKSLTFSVTAEPYFASPPKKLPCMPRRSGGVGPEVTLIRRPLGICKQRATVDLFEATTVR